VIAWRFLISGAQHKIKSVKLGPGGPVEGQHDRFILCCEKPEDLDGWVKAVQSNMVQSPCLQLINLKKAQMAKRIQHLFIRMK
jgi:hypothetical protein